MFLVLLTKVIIINLKTACKINVQMYRCTDASILYGLQDKAVTFQRAGGCIITMFMSECNDNNGRKTQWNNANKEQKPRSIIMIRRDGALLVSTLSAYQC